MQTRNSLLCMYLGKCIKSMYTICIIHTLLYTRELLNHLVYEPWSFWLIRDGLGQNPTQGHFGQPCPINSFMNTSTVCTSCACEVHLLEASFFQNLPITRTLREHQIPEMFNKSQTHSHDCHLIWNRQQSPSDLQFTALYICSTSV